MSEPKHEATEAVVLLLGLAAILTDSPRCAAHVPGEGWVPALFVRHDMALEWAAQLERLAGAVIAGSCPEADAAELVADLRARARAYAAQAAMQAPGHA
jgi:hypothetical protein